MSWAADDWTAGLTGRVLQKVRELQAQQERLGRERQQKQLQLDNAEAALHKHKQKGEEVRAELAVAQRELSGVREQAQGEVRARERLAQDLQARQAQVCSLEGQLEAAHTLTGNLTKEIKRLEAELEKLQRANGSGDSMLFSTPCWNMASPWEHNSSKLDERAGHRGEGEGRLAHVRQQLQFSDSPRSVSSGAPSPFPQQPHKATPGRRSARNPDASTPTAVFPWERDDTRSVPRGRTASSAAPSGELITGAQDAPGDCGMEEDLRKERDAQTLKIQELKTWVQSLEKDLRTEAERLKESEARLGEAKRELAGREQSLMRTKDELGRAHTLIGQERDRAQASDQRAKQLQEELKCQRQNAETCRSNAEQKRKEVEREHQRELLELQKERQALERQHQQESHKLNQEIQQARALHHTLQSQHDKLGLQKQAVEQELYFIKGKLKGTEAELQDTQKREAQTQAKLTEALRDSESLTVTVEQLKRKERSLEEEVKRLSEELADALRRLKELQDQPPAPAAVVTPPQYSSCGDGFNPAVSYDRPGPHQTQTHKKKALRVDRTKEEAIQRAKYPSDREPGEGIDSEQIKEFGSEQPAKGRRKKGRRGKTGWRDEESDQTDEAGEILSSALEEEEEEDASCDEGETNQLCPKPQLTEALISSSRSSAECSRSKPTPPSPSRSPTRGGGGAQTTDLKRENVALRDELRDTKQELERRLDDLESQRRAEAEARTKLKQLSRKHSTQTEQLRHKAQEQQEERQRLERQLEEARRDAGRLEEALAAAEGRLEESREERVAEAAGERSECERLREALTEMERKGREMEEESGRLKEDLEALRVELTQEREDREKGREEEEEEEEELQGKEEGAGKEDLLAKVAELEAELGELRKAPKENLQLKYLQLNGSCDDNKAMVFNDEDIIPSPIDHVSFCQAVNLQNSMVSQEASTKNFITDLGACKKLAEHSRNEKEVRSAGLAQEVERLKVECESLRGERDRESGRVKATQNRLEALQKQVTSQTQQLTRAFESQSSHIEGLLLELQQRDAALQRQGEELRLCQEEMAQVRAAKEKLETEVRTEAPQIDSSDEAKEVSVHPDATVDKNQPEAHCDTIDNTKAKTLDREVDVLSVKDVSNTSTPVEPQSGEQHKAGAQSNTSNVPLQTADTNAQDVSATDVQSGSLPCEIAASGNPVAFVEGSGNLNEKRSVHTQTTVQESSGEVPLDAGDPRHGGPATALASGQPERSHNSTLQQSPADVLALDASTMTEAAEESPEIQGEVDLLRAQNAQLTQKLKEASAEELQSVRVENEKLKSRLKQLETASVHGQEDVPAGREDDGASRLCPEGQGDLSVQTPDAENTEERVPPVQPVSGQPEATTVTETTVERSAEKESVGEDTLSHSDDASHQQQLQALLVELRRLTGENESQAEELELWRTAASQEPSALLPGATAGRRGDGDGILVVRREDHILLSCGADKLSGQLLETRSMIHHQSEEAGGHPSTTTTTTSPTTTQQQPQDSPAPPKVEVDHGASVKSLESKAGELIDEVSSCHEVETETKDSRRSAEDLRSETRSSDRGGYNTKANLCGSPTETKIVTGHTDQDHELAGHRAPAPHAKANSVSCTTDQVQSSKETSGDAAARTKADDSGPETALVQTPTREPPRAPARPAELVVRTASVTPGGTSPAETHRHGAEEKRRAPEASSRDGAEGQSSEVTGVERAEVIRREVRSAATQTEEETHAQSPENTPQRAALLDAGTQTDGGPEEEEEEEDEEEEDEVTDSPCPSPGATAESERLLLSGAFPIPANPAHLAERIRRNRNRMSAAYDDTEYEPYGLPEVVMKGFADIPSGPACPYVLRRGLLGTPAVPLPAREEEGDTDP